MEYQYTPSKFGNELKTYSLIWEPNQPRNPIPSPKSSRKLALIGKWNININQRYYTYVYNAQCHKLCSTQLDWVEWATRTNWFVINIVALVTIIRVLWRGLKSIRYRVKAVVNTPTRYAENYQKALADLVIHKTLNWSLDKCIRDRSNIL